MDVSFYELTATSLEKVLPKLLEKAYESGQHVVVILDTEERVQQMNSVLWTYSTLSFLPHASSHDAPKDLSKVPIWLTTRLENPNRAQILVITTGEILSQNESFQRCLDIFDGNHSESISQAHIRYQSYQKQGIKCIFWRQTLTGQWEKQSD